MVAARTPLYAQAEARGKQAPTARPRAMARRADAGGRSLPGEDAAGRLGPGGAAQLRLQAALDGSARVSALGVRSRAMERAPAAAASSIQRARGGGASGQPRTIRRVIYGSIDALLTAALAPDPVPDLAALDTELLRFLGDAEDQLPYTDVISDPALHRVAEATPTPALAYPYRLEYNPTTPKKKWLVASILHELVHVAGARRYRKAGAVVDPWTNLNLPPDAGGAPLAGPALTAEIEAQEDVLVKNIFDLDHVIANDTTLTGRLRHFLQERAQYAFSSQPRVHYDTVIADMMAYMQLKGFDDGPTFRFLRRLAAEANDRRLVAPYWGTKRARRVDRNARWYQITQW